MCEAFKTWNVYFKNISFKNKNGNNFSSDTQVWLKDTTTSVDHSPYLQRMPLFCRYKGWFLCGLEPNDVFAQKHFWIDAVLVHVCYFNVTATDSWASLCSLMCLLPLLHPLHSIASIQFKGLAIIQSLSGLQQAFKKNINE